MNILWIGKYASKEDMDYLKLFRYRDPAAQKSQGNIIKSFDDIDIPLDTINAFNVSFRSKITHFRRRVWHRTPSSYDVRVGFVNLPYIGHFFRLLSVGREVKKYIREIEEPRTNRIVIVYGVQSTLLNGAIVAKKRGICTKIILVVPDLPWLMNPNESRLRYCIKKLDWKYIKKQLRYVDGYVYYSKHMDSYININKKPYIVIEGSINPQEYLESNNVDNIQIKSILKDVSLDKKSVMYSGNLNSIYGLDKLVDAYKMLPKNKYELWITGFGKIDEDILKICEGEMGIKFLGYVENHQDLLVIQSRATMLINLRSPDETMSKFSFPSKILEFMASGRPTLTPMIEGIPQEYLPYLIPISSFNAKSICDSILFVGESEPHEMTLFGKRARQFVLTEKSNIKQTKKLLEFLE